MKNNSVRLTMAQALVRYLVNQYTEIDGERVPLFGGAFGIFGHGNVTCLAEALEQVQDRFPTWRGQNEQSMALAAVGYTKAKKRRHQEGHFRPEVLCSAFAQGHLPTRVEETATPR